MADSGKFQLKIYDNFHYMDEDETYVTGNFDTYDDALAAAKKIVDDFLYKELLAGRPLAELYETYVSYGEDPDILGDTPEGIERFSAWTYARQRCQSDPDDIPAPPVVPTDDSDDSPLVMKADDGRVLVLLDSSTMMRDTAGTWAAVPVPSFEELGHDWAQVRDSDEERDLSEEAIEHS